MKARPLRAVCFHKWICLIWEINRLLSNLPCDWSCDLVTRKHDGCRGSGGVRAPLTLSRQTFHVSLQVINCWKIMWRSNHNNQAVCKAVRLFAAVCKTASFSSQQCQIRMGINFWRLQENNYTPLEDFVASSCVYIQEEHYTNSFSL